MYRLLMSVWEFSLVFRKFWNFNKIKMYRLLMSVSYFSHIIWKFWNLKMTFPYDCTRLLENLSSKSIKIVVWSSKFDKIDRFWIQIWWKIWVLRSDWAWKWRFLTQFDKYFDFWPQFDQIWAGIISKPFPYIWQKSP